MDVYDKRRKMADRLRFSVECARPADEVPDSEVLAVLCVGTGRHEGFAYAGDVLRLADLIDRPTCGIKSNVPITGGWACTRCGERYDGYSCAGDWRFCPNCGAEVVR